MKKLIKIFTMAMSLLLVVGTVSVSAANYTAIPGTTTQLDKYLVVEADAEIPAAEFTFTIASGSAAEATADTVKVWAGLNPENVKIGDVMGESDGKVVFTAGEEATNANAKVALADDTTDKLAAKHPICLDFTAVNFPEPGVYRYVLTESAAAQGSPITHDVQPVRTIDVYVEDNNGTLAVTGYVSYLGNVSSAAPKNTVVPSAVWLAEHPEPVAPTVADPANPTPEEEAALAQYETDKAAWDAAALAAVPNGAEAGTKSNKYVNEMDSADLTVSKTVTGNQGSHDQYFEFTITIGNAGAGTVMTLDMTNAETETHENSATTFTKAAMDEANQKDDDSGNEGKAGQQVIADTNGSATFKVYLHHGQNVVLKGLPVGATYKVEETDAAGYTTTGEVATPTAITSEDVEVAVVNNREGVVPTGVMMSVAGGAALVAIAGAGIYLSRRKREED